MGITSSIKKLFNYQDTSKDTKLVIEKPFYPRGETAHTDKELPRTELGLIVMKEPMIRKGIWKENKDIFGEGWIIEHIDPELEVDPIDQQLINDFDKHAQTKYKLEQAGISSNIYGDGFLEIIFEEPKGTTIDKDIPKSPPIDLNVLLAEYICQTEKMKDGIEYYVFKKNQKKYIHPNRIQHIAKKRLPGHLFGISDVFTCSRVLTSMMNADIYFGEFIEWAGKGVFTLKLNGANQTQLDDAEKKIKRRNVQIFNEDAEWGVLNPVTMSPKEFYDYFFIKVAATLDMPQHILTGVQPGQLTGSEIGLSDYYKNIVNLQELVFTPVLEHIYKLLLEGNGRSFDNYKITWNPIYVDENSEAQILQARTNAASQAMDRFVIDANEYRTIMKEGITSLSGEQTLNDDDEDVVEPVEEPEPKDNENFNPVELISDEEQLRIQREKRLGELELLMQEKRLKDAEKKNRNKATKTTK